MADKDAHWPIAMEGTPIPHFDHAIITPAKNDIRVHSVRKADRIDLIIVGFLYRRDQLVHGHIMNEKLRTFSASKDFFAIIRQLDRHDAMLLTTPLLLLLLLARWPATEVHELLLLSQRRCVD